MSEGGVAGSGTVAYRSAFDHSVSLLVGRGALGSAGGLTPKGRARDAGSLYLFVGGRQPPLGLDIRRVEWADAPQMNHSCVRQSRQRWPKARRVGLPGTGGIWKAEILTL